MSIAVPVNIPLFNGNEKKYLNECIDSGWVSSEGPFIEKFEINFSQYVNRNYGIAVSSGSAALDIAVKAIGISAEDEVIIPTFTIISPVLSVIKAGGIPVFIDSDSENWNMDTNLLEAKITPKTKAILILHIYGLPVNIDAVIAVAQKFNLIIIEDAAEILGQTYFGKKCGSFGLISVFSFYANKNITTGEGGMIVCDDEELANKCKKYRNLAFEPDKARFVHYELGWNYRMTNMQAALGLAQLEQIEDFIEKKKLLGNYYQSELSFLKNHGFQLPLDKTAYAENIYWVFGLVAPLESEKERIVDILRDKKIGTRPFFWCMHEQPLFATANFNNNLNFPVAENLARRGFYLPSGLGTTEMQMEVVTKSIKSVYG